MRRSSGHRPIGQMLMERGLLTEEQLKEALQTQKQTTQLLGEVLVDLGFVEKKALYEALSAQMHIPYLDVSPDTVDPGVATLLPKEDAERYRAIPVGRETSGGIKVAMAEPGDVMAIDALRMVLQVPVVPILSDPDSIQHTLDKVYAGGGGGGVPAAGQALSAEAAPSPGPARRGREKGGEGGSVDMQALAESVRDSGIIAAEETAPTEDRAELDRIADIADEAPIIKIAKLVIQRSLHERASDIHVEPYQNRVRVRYRIDGVLHDVLQLPKYVHAPLLSRLKIMANMNIAERRLPQDGRIHVRHADSDYDLRASVIPTTLGEKMVMRVLDKKGIQRGLGDLGFDENMLGIIEKLIRQPNGMILSTGPTGSGKTTTQYNILNHILSVEHNIITIEDPVEYQLDGISQVNVNRKAGLTFAIALKYFLRQDPDIILVGEVRDLETSEIAIQAALTGHLVLTSLHTNDAPSTVTRLVDMGVEPFLIASSIIGVISQRLARTICPNCREPYQPRKDLLLTFGFDPDLPENKDQVFYHGRGCEACRGTGYRGRLGVFELLVMNGELAELIIKRASSGQLREAALASGMVTMAEDGFSKALRGITTVEDLSRVIFTAGAW
ncbi:MAG: Flp pilus assembly complex ATPase component TadA [candidate division WS1 bacterium]|nr:Flp pilus assembly complex ATPase component TadA [candidate division WS1 bacterium]